MYDIVNDPSITVLLNIFIYRDDLKNAYPETFDGNLNNIIKWAVKFGLTVDGNKNLLIPYKKNYEYYIKMPVESKIFNINILRQMLHGNTQKTIWDDSAEQYLKNGFKSYWELLKEVKNYQNEIISGDPDKDILTYIIEIIKNKYPAKKNLKCCIIGCYVGRPEVLLNKPGIFEEIEVLDIAEGLLIEQKNIADKEGLKNINYKYADFNKHKFLRNHYDIIISFGTVHHIEKLEYFFSQIQRSLKTDGLFIMREYVGPNRIQFTDTQLDLVNSLLKLIPPEYRIQADKQLKEKQKNDLKLLILNDPSESIRSEDIIPVMKKYLELIEIRGNGGALLHPLLNGIAGNFEKDEHGIEILRALIEIEKNFTRSELLPSDYMFVVANPKLV
jgi:2-polyprenyl-3-methyl-5-hydroxy-6-metoxy-1,4-benzoquinol methylase